MQVEAIERHIHYATAPGSNGETDFYDVFRRAYPTDAGVTARQPLERIIIFILIKENPIGLIQ